MESLLQLFMLIYFIVGAWLGLKIIINFKKIINRHCTCEDTGTETYVHSSKKTEHVDIEMPDTMGTTKAVNLKSEVVRPSKRRKI